MTEEHKSDSTVSARANTIVVADDFRPFRRFVRLTLQENGFANVAEASDGLEAVAKAADLHPDLIFLDIGMPNLDGIKAAETNPLYCSRNENTLRFREHRP